MRALELACTIIQLGNISGGTWKPFGNTLDLGMEPGSHISFGASISVSSNGSIMAVSSSTTDDSYTQGVYIYEEYTDPDTHEFAWRQMGTTISSHDGSEENLSSISLSNDGLTIAIGSCSYSSNAGRVLIYSYSADSDNWVLDYLYSGSVSGEQLGFSVAISGDGLIVVAGAPTYNTDDGVVKSFAFNKVLQQWEHMNDLLYESVETGALFGTTLSANRQIVAVGAIASSSNAGSVHVYNCSATACEAVGSVLSGDWEDDMFGNALSLSGDGLWLAVSANASSGSYVRVYYYNTDSMDWELNKSYRGNDINKNYGSCVVLSEDGSTLAIGSITDPGYVYVTHYNALSRNVALNKSALQSTQTEISTPELAINGNTRGILSDGNCLATAEEMNPWMMIDLEGSFIINQIVINERLDCSGCDASLYDLSVEILSQAQQVLETLTYPGIVIDQVSLVTNGNPIGSYIKITRGGTTSAEMTICEVEVFGLEADSATPSITPSIQPSLTKSSIPTLSLSLYPSSSPSSQSSLTPSYLPSFNQTAPPSLSPSFPSSISPTTKPTSKASINPSFQPSLTPPSLPSKKPSTAPSPYLSPTLLPSIEPSASLSTSPSYLPSMSSSWYPSRLSSKKPPTAPSTHPSQSPSLLHSVEPSASLSTSPSYLPSMSSI